MDEGVPERLDIAPVRRHTLRAARPAGCLLADAGPVIPGH